MKFLKLKLKYGIIPVIILAFSCIIQVPIINFVRAESCRYMVTNYKNNVKEDVLKGVEIKVKSKLKDSLKPQVIQELRTELLDEVMSTLKSDLTKEIRGERKWINSSNPNVNNGPKQININTKKSDEINFKVSR